MINRVEQFIKALDNVGGKSKTVANVAEVVDYITAHLDGALLMPDSASLQRAGVPKALDEAGISVIDQEFRERGVAAAGGLTGANFGIAATGTVALESTAENVRIATTLPEKHFVILDPGKIMADSREVLPFVRQMHERQPQTYLAYLTGPSRTADIERVLTIGVHGPRELHVLLMEGVSDDPLES